MQNRDTRDPTVPRRVGIIGGGITGLTAAWELARRDAAVKVTLFEAGDHAGGVLQTRQTDGFQLELGPDSILRRLPWGQELCRDVGLADEMIGTERTARGVFTVHRGRFVRMPEAMVFGAPQKIWPVVRTPILSWRGKLRMAAERILPPRRSSEDESLADFARRRFGAEALHRILQPMAAGIYMGDPERLGMQASFPQLVAAEQEYGSLIKWSRQLAKEANASGPRPAATLFTAPRRGFGQLVNAVQAKLPEETLRLNHAVETIRRSEGGWQVEGTETTDRRPFRERFDQLLLATPASKAASLVAECDAELSRLLASIEHTGVAVLHFAYPRDAIRHPIDASGFVAPHIEDQVLQACTFSSVKYAGRAPSDAVLLRVFLGGAQRPDLVGAPEKELLAIARTALEKLLQIDGRPVLEHVARWQATMPQYSVGHLARVEQIQQHVAQAGDLAIAGNALAGVGVPHCIRSAKEAVDLLLSHAVDRASPTVTSPP